jgi:hypothetical protein
MKATPPERPDGRPVESGAAPGLVEGRVALAPSDDDDRRDIGAERQQGVAHERHLLVGIPRRPTPPGLRRLSSDEVLWRSKPALAGMRGGIVSEAPPKSPGWRRRAGRMTAPTGLISRSGPAVSGAGSGPGPRSAARAPGWRGQSPSASPPFLDTRTGVPRIGRRSGAGRRSLAPQPIRSGRKVARRLGPRLDDRRVVAVGARQTEQVGCDHLACCRERGRRPRSPGADRAGLDQPLAHDEAVGMVTRVVVDRELVQDAGQRRQPTLSGRSGG